MIARKGHDLYILVSEEDVRNLKQGKVLETITEKRYRGKRVKISLKTGSKKRIEIKELGFQENLPFREQWIYSQEPKIKKDATEYLIRINLKSLIKWEKNGFPRIKNNPFNGRGRMYNYILERTIIEYMQTNNK